MDDDGQTDSGQQDKDSGAPIDADGRVANEPNDANANANGDADDDDENSHAENTVSHAHPSL